MPTWSSLEAFGRDLDKLARELEREEARRITRQMAERAQEIAKQAASADLGGDDAFSGWRRNNPINLDTQIRTVDGGRGHLLTPTRSSAGPWTVAERGRNVGETGKFLGPGMNHNTGITSRTKTGNIRRRGFKAKRWNGVTRGKDTASDALERMDRELPRMAEREVRRVMIRRFDVD